VIDRYLASNAEAADELERPAPAGAGDVAHHG
jgi:hypothetical protein